MNGRTVVVAFLAWSAIVLIAFGFDAGAHIMRKIAALGWF